MQFKYEKDLEQRRLIKENTRISLTLGIASIITSLIYLLITYLIIKTPTEWNDTLEDIWMIVNIVVILIMVVILALRKTLYYSSRIVKEKDTLRDILVKWQKLDIILIGVAQVIPILGLILRIFGLPFNQCFHFFVGSAILFLLLTPFSIKVNSKLLVLRRNNPNINI